MSPEEVRHRIAEFERREPGWDYGEGGPISRSVTALAISLVHLAEQLGFSEMEVFAGRDDSITISLYREQNELEFIIRNRTNVSYFWDIDDVEEEYAENVAFEQAMAWLFSTRSKLWNLSVTSIPTIGPNQRIDLSELPLPLARIAASLLPQWIVSSVPRETFVATARSIPKTSWALL